MVLIEQPEEPIDCTGVCILGQTVTYPENGNPNKPGYLETLKTDQEAGLCPFGRNRATAGIWDRPIFEHSGHLLVQSLYPHPGIPKECSLLVIPKLHEVGPKYLTPDTFQAYGTILDYVTGKLGKKVIGIGQRFGQGGGATVAHNHLQIICAGRSGWTPVPFVFGCYQQGENLLLANTALRDIGRASHCPLCQLVETGRPLATTSTQAAFQSPFLRWDVQGGHPKQRILIIPHQHTNLLTFSRLEWRNRGEVFQKTIRQFQIDGGAILEWWLPEKPHQQHACLELIVPRLDPKRQNGASVAVHFLMGATGRTGDATLATYPQ